MMAAGDQALPFVPGDHYNIPPVLVVRMLKASSRRSMAAWGFCPVLEACFSVAMNQS